MEEAKVLTDIVEMISTSFAIGITAGLTLSTYAIHSIS